MRRISVLRSLAAAYCVLLCGCASVQGYPNDPVNEKKALADLDAYLDDTQQKAYDAAISDAERVKVRNSLISGRKSAYDIEYYNFEKQLTSFSHSTSLGADLAGLTIGGLTATVGGAATKAALGAASIGILGANTAINKELFYTNTIPAMTAQMEANRAKAYLILVAGMKKSAAEYDLTGALNDLQNYRNAGTINAAVAAITQKAKDEKESTDESIVNFDRDEAFVRTLPDTIKVRSSFSGLTDAQLLILARAMQPHLANRPAGVQSIVKVIDPNDGRLNGDAVLAKDALRAWIELDNMTAENASEWAEAISTAAKTPAPVADLGKPATLHKSSH